MVRFSKEDCLTDIKMRILKTELAPGLMLDEASLAAHYGLSRTPLREVLQRLAGAGYISSQENKGAKVASMDITTMRTFFQTAPMIYAHISRLAAENRTDAQLKSLQTAQRDFANNTSAGDAGAAAMSNHKFHAIIGEMASNPYLVASLNRLLIDHTRLSQTFYRPVSDTDRSLIAQASDQHDALIAAIEGRDPEQATELTLLHWDLSRDHLERFVRPDPLPVDVFSKKDRENAV